MHPLKVSENARPLRATVAGPEKTTTPESIATSGAGFPEAISDVLFEGLGGRNAPDASATAMDGFCKYLAPCRRSNVGMGGGRGEVTLSYTQYLMVEVCSNVPDRCLGKLW